ncbi:MAG TPA: NAD+ synthase, partial [Candidatus Acidoferrum sp.]|nr:NAD+ synthase [Candidatus Acidoferrum sp.]
MGARPADTLAIAVAQLNATVGDISGNVEKVRIARATAAAQGADLVVFPELFIAGYPPEDLVLKPAFQAGCRSALEQLARDTASAGPALLVGTPWLDGGKLHNAVALLDGGSIAALRYKVDLPNYGVFDEKRVFVPGPMPGPVNFRGVRLGIPICEDIWGTEVVECLAETGAEMLVVPNGSPYWRQKGDVRINIAVARVTEQNLPTIYVNQVGGQDELVFDGVSFGLHADCSVAFQMAGFQESVVTTRWVRRNATWRCDGGPVVSGVEADRADYSACVLGLRDYVNKNGFPGVVLGLSGGIDSALCAAIAVDALGTERVRCIMLPYKFTSQESLRDAAACAELLGVRYEILPIAAAVDGFEAALKPVFSGLPRDVTEENLQARARGTILMAVSNKF